MYSALATLAILTPSQDALAERAHWIEQAYLDAPEPLDQPLAEAPQPDGRAFGLGETPSGLVGFGPGYSVVFEEAGPVLQVFDVEFALEPARFALEFDSVRLGDDRLQTRSPDGFRWNEHSVTYPIGEGFDLVYDVTEDGLELSLDLARRPRGDGDLTIRTRLLDRDRGGLLHLEENGRASVSIGDVLAFDAAGRRFEGHKTCRDGLVEFGVDGSVLREAAFPLRVDPIFGGVSWRGVPHRVVEMDVTYDDSRRQFGLVYSREGDRLCVMQRSDSFYYYRSVPLDFSSHATKNKVSICNVNEGNWFVTAMWKNGLVLDSIPAGGGPRVSTLFVDIAPPTNDFELGGEMLPPYKQILLAYTGPTTGLKTRLVRVGHNGNMSLEGSQITAYSGHPRDLSVSQSGGAPGHWALAFEVSHDVKLLTVSFTNTLSTTPRTITNVEDPECTTDGSDVYVTMLESHDTVRTRGYRRSSGLLGLRSDSFRLERLYSPSITQIGDFVFLAARDGDTPRMWMYDEYLNPIEELDFPSSGTPSGVRGTALASSSQSATLPSAMWGLFGSWSDSHLHLARFYP